MAVRGQLASRVNQGPGKLPPEQYRNQLAELNAEADRLEGALSRHSAEFRTQSQPVTLEWAQETLLAGTALVELAVYRPYNRKRPRNLKSSAPRATPPM